STANISGSHENEIFLIAIAPVAIVIALLVTPLILRFGGASRSSRLIAAAAAIRRALVGVRNGLVVFRNPKLGAIGTGAQLAAWALQWLACYILIKALGISAGTGIGAAAAVLFAVNVAAVLPATPANIGVFQAACATVLHLG